MEVCAGSLVYSIAGRDRGGLFVVVEVLDGYCYLCDGKRRRVERPKKKKLKHVKPAGGTVDTLKNKLEKGESLTNAEIRRIIRNFLDEKVS